ncbi:LytR/AlgR family response regulator transcription factor [Roseivirga pacifica]|uniref:LytR/AlgR family response regulator transcription factor n=1 Tax=Roseivirga pacifica TaxID=1267423 RepID=UPI00209635AC|nr:LytTR family DNA-binding domain-containing protein [Roseivirga pacifica]MCO6359252.1 response regulator [Roseivirga pacifica]MCO6365112.1 response regulator [Roseivirga pacifica]MCO6372158.1 response regulator [Roseivirga pacifica]MCO6375731.1 response regulator [Roseivirga pacifica]MCO6379536.1 response regulator [Roseivirga pacifica]
MKVVVFEDEKLASERLIQLLQSIRPDAEVLASMKSVEAALLWLENNEQPDLIISDIQLLDGTSFEIFEQHKIECPVIFTTAFDEYAIKAFEVNSIDYLLKPIQKEKLEVALSKLQAQQSSASSLDIDSIREMLKSETVEYKSRFLVKLGQRIRAIPVEKIAYFYSQDKLTFLVTFENQKYPIDQTLEELDALLNPKNYFRVNRKFLVHFDAVADIHPYFKGRVKLGLEPQIDEDIVVSSEKTPVFKQWLDS